MFINLIKVQRTISHGCKDKEPKVLRAAKRFRKILKEKMAIVSGRPKRPELEKVSVSMEVCAHPKVLDQFMKQVRSSIPYFYGFVLE